MGELAFGGREDKNLEGRASIGGIFPGGENKQTFGWWEEPPPPSFPVGKPIYIYIYIVSAYVLIPVVFSVSQGTEKLNKLPQAHKKPLIIPLCCSCLAITLILISEQPKKTS